MKSGIGEVFSAGYVKFKNYLRASFSGLNDADAEDIVQQTALSMLQRDDGDDIEYVSAYIYASLRNAAKNLFRKRSREVLGTEVEQRASAEDELMRFELEDAVSEALSMLDDKSRFVFEQTEFEGRSYKELSEQTGEPIGTLLSRKSRAVKKLAILLSDYKNL